MGAKKTGPSEDIDRYADCNRLINSLTAVSDAGPSTEIDSEITGATAAKCTKLSVRSQALIIKPCPVGRLATGTPFF
jgi:hypothetical protein